jgi:hypothetical protein
LGTGGREFESLHPDIFPSFRRGFVKNLSFYILLLLILILSFVFLWPSSLTFKAKAGRVLSLPYHKPIPISYLSFQNKNYFSKVTGKMDIDISFPFLDNPTFHSFNRSLKKFVVDYLKKNKNQKKESTLIKISSFITHNDSLKMISVVLVCYNYPFHMAHGMSEKVSFLVDYNGKIRSVDTLFSKKQKKSFESLLKKEFKKLPFYPLIQDYPRKPNAFNLNTAALSFLKDCLKVSYPLYTLAPYSYGFIELSLPITLK